MNEDNEIERALQDAAELARRIKKILESVKEKNKDEDRKKNFVNLEKTKEGDK